MAGGGIRATKYFCQMTIFGWHQGKWLCKFRIDKGPILFMNMDGKELPVEFYDHTVTNKIVGVCKSPDEYMKGKVMEMLQKAKDWKRKMYGAPVKLHLTWQILKRGIWFSSAYLLPSTVVRDKNHTGAIPGLNPLFGY